MFHLHKEQKKMMMILPAFVIFIILYCYPLGKLFADSLYSFDVSSLNRDHFVGLGNYSKVLTSGKFYSAVWNTIKYRCV